jgi:hypothetical protein
MSQVRPRLVVPHIASLPEDVQRQRILPTPQALELVCVSPASWRRLRRLGVAPTAVQIGLKKQGYRLGDLLDWMKSREQPAA